MPRSASIAAISEPRLLLLRLAISRNALQNSGSNEMLVRWPAIVTECLTRSLVIRSSDHRA